MKTINIILSGGSGTRLWPLSRHSKPKQFLPIFGGKSLFQHTLERNKDLVDEFMIITNKNQYVQALAQATGLKIDLDYKIIEPIGRNTAPAIALAALSVATGDVLFVTPSDHMISDAHKYKVCLEKAVDLAKKDKLVTFGIRPTRPDTGFGYIEFDGEEVLQFREKPDLETAISFLEQGNFCWNSGMFCFKAGTFLEALKEADETMYSTCVAAYKTMQDGHIDLEAMKAIPSQSIDYAVMEKSNIVKTVASDFDWSDLGSFDAIIEFQQQGGTVDNLTTIEGTNNKHAYSFGDQKVFADNINNQIWVTTSDASVVLPYGESGDIKGIYTKVKKYSPELLE